MSLLITLEGIKGSGKTTLINNLKKSGELEMITDSWRDTKLGQKVLHLINEIQSEEWKKDVSNEWTYIFLLFSLFNELNQKIIKPGLKENKVIIIDSYIDSAFTYRELEGNLKISNIQEVVKKTIYLTLPDITFVLDIDPQKSYERLKKRNLITSKNDSWDKSKLKLHHKIRKKYLELKNFFPERIYIIDADKNEDEILEEVQSIIKKCLPEEENKKNLPSFSRVVIKNKKGELLLVKDKKWGWNLPGGKIELGETPEIAACREVFEETNLEIDSLQKIGEEIVFFANLPPGKQHWIGYFFQTDKYSGEIKNKGDVADIKFFNTNSKGEVAVESGSAYEFYLEKIRKKYFQ